MMMNKKKQKKAMSEMWWIIGGAVLVLIIVILILVWFRGSGGKAVGGINKQIEGLQDCDKDQVADLFDKCPCDPAVQETLESGKTCGSSSDSAKAECPNDCK